MNDYRITKEQRAYLDSLVCQRISKNQANRAIIGKFRNFRNRGLAYALKTGWNQDKKDKIAYYIVREPGDDGEPLLFFSLKCGEVANPFDEERLLTILENSEALKNAAYGLDAPEWAAEVIEKQKVNGVLPRDVRDTFVYRHINNQERLHGYLEELHRDGQNIVRTQRTMAGVELVHFCVHSPAVQKWNAMELCPQSLGRTMFWNFVVPVIQQVRELVGCEYIYLFAADREKNGHLVNYYNQLGFESREDLSVSKPEYDFCCFFMCQKVTALRNKRNAFFRSYNAPKEIVES